MINIERLLEVFGISVGLVDCGVRFLLKVVYYLSLVKINKVIEGIECEYFLKRMFEFRY